jgi:hypothetical protein
MADNTLFSVPYKRYVSTNDKEDFIKERLRRLEIAYATIAKYPEILNEYICAVKGGVNHPAEAVTTPVSKKQIEIQQEH